MLRLRDNPSEYAAWVNENAVRFDEGLRQPVERAVHQLIMVMVRSVQTGAEVARPTLTVTKAQVQTFTSQRQSGRSRNR